MDHTLSLRPRGATTITRTAEFVSPGHPDKICDILSDYILDLYLTEDPQARVAVELMGGHGELYVCGEITSTATIDIAQALRQRLGQNIKIHLNLVRQSPEIARGVDIGGAGDQGIMVGYACAENEWLMPTEYILARDLCRTIYSKYAFDGKTQVTIELTYDAYGKLISSELKHVVLSWQNVTTKMLRRELATWVDNLPIPNVAIADDLKTSVNPAGDWLIGGFDADTGLTGRKIIVDNYGPRVPVGGGAFSGKDPSKVDRSAAYMARKIATDYLCKRQANEVFVQIAYALGETEPIDATVVVDGRPEHAAGYDLSPQGIIRQLELLEPHYAERATWGHHFNSL